MAEQHHGVIRATVNNEVYEIRIFRSQLSPDTYLFLMHDQDKEVMVNKRLQQARREYDKNVQARKLMLHNPASSSISRYARCTIWSSVCATGRMSSSSRHCWAS